MNRINLNIQNLTLLWELGAQVDGTFQNHVHHAVALVSDGEWPNKIWFHQPPTESFVAEIKDRYALDGMTIPVWSADIEASHALMQRHGFELKSQLVGMSMVLDKPFREASKLTLKRVEDEASARAWSEVFQNAFGYLIDARTVSLTKDTVGYYIGYHNDTPVGTVVRYQPTPNVVGIHSMGVLPSHRRMGFAEDLLLEALNMSINRGAKHATLQASAMGQGLYQKVGFQEDFKLNNYIITKTPSL